MQFIVATHGRLAEGYLDTIQHLTGVDTVHAICAYTAEAEFPQNLVTLLNSFEKNEPVLMFADLTGGSVCQQAAALIPEYPDLHLFGGVNLGLVLQLVLEQPELTVDALETIVMYAREEITYLNAMLR